MERVEVALRVRAVATVADPQALREQLQAALDAVTVPLVDLGDAVQWATDNVYRAEVLRDEESAAQDARGEG